MSPSLLDVRLRPGVRALTAVVSVLHARAADVAGMTYCIRSGDASLLIRLNAASDETQLLARQIQRNVDVTHVRVRGQVHT